MTTNHLHNLRMRAPPDAHQLVMATDGHPVRGNPDALAHPLAAQRVDHLSERDRRGRRLTDLQRGRRRARRPAVASVLRDRRVLGAALDRVHTKPAHRHLRARLLRATLRVALRRTAIHAAIDLRDPGRTAAQRSPSRTARQPSQARRPEMTATPTGGCCRPESSSCTYRRCTRRRHRSPAIVNGIAPCPIIRGLDRRARARACALMPRARIPAHRGARAQRHRLSVDRRRQAADPRWRVAVERELPTIPDPARRLPQTRTSDQPGSLRLVDAQVNPADVEVRRQGA